MGKLEIGRTYELRNGSLLHTRKLLEIHRAQDKTVIGVTYENDYGQRRRVSIVAWCQWRTRAQELVRHSVNHHASMIQRAIGGGVEVKVFSDRLPGGEWAYETKGGEVVRREA